MITGKCPKCGSTEIYHKINGITDGNKYIYIHVSRMTPRSDKMTYLCTSCGYYENYAMDKDSLKKVREKWDKI